jgi:thiamine-monophosphate kinase
MNGPDSTDASGDEFTLIADLFAPLASHPAARGLKDDAALWPAAGPMVMTCDAVVEGVHFLSNDPIATVAQKALRVNLSDLAAKAAQPAGVLLSLIWPNHRPAAEIAEFAAGLQADLQAFGVALIGGDMTTTPGPLTISITAFGELVGARCPARDGAQPGDLLWVSGAIGDGHLGLALLQKGAKILAEPDRAFLINRYRLPQPRLDLAPLLAQVATASMDVSDGLIADARKIAAASRVRLRLDPQAVPLSQAAQRAVQAGSITLRALLTGGDDYEVLFTAPAHQRQAIEAEASRLGVPLSVIGETEAGQGVSVLTVEGVDWGATGGGYVHRLGAP